VSFERVLPAGTYTLSADALASHSDIGGTSTTGSAQLSFTLSMRCRSDFDRSGSIGVPDIFAFLAAWFASDHAADMNADGALSVGDIFDFLAAWFAGCP
jgi:hypothetical protein